MDAREQNDGHENAREGSDRWRHLPPRIVPEEWSETVPATTPDEAPVVLGNGVAYRSGVPITD